MKLDDDDRAALAALRDGPADAAALADRIGVDRDRLAERLAEMADNDLVEAGGGGGGEGDGGSAGASVDRPYALTDSGRRVLTAPGDGSADDRIDVPGPVEDAISAADLRADEASALRAAVAFLDRGDATPAELAAAIYPEEPAGRDDARAWWRDLRDPLATLSGVEPPGEGDADGAPAWRYASGDRRTGATARRDGRIVLGSGARKSLRRTVRDLDLPSDERTALRAAVQRLFERGPLAGEELAAVCEAAPAGYDSPAAWLDGLGDALAALPGVAPPDDADGEWRFDPPDDRSAVGSGGERTGPPPSDTGTPGTADGEPADTDGSVEDGSGDESGHGGPRTDGGEGACPVCGRSVDGRVYIDASETVLPASDKPICVRVTPSDRAADGGITLYYHGRERTRERAATGE